MAQNDSLLPLKSDNNMKLGYIHTNREEQAKVQQVMKLLSESVALDELGIGRLRDAFADILFPGISTLQTHLKYFSLMPQLYKKATEKRYNRITEVREEIIRLERIMTKNLYYGSIDKRGIIGNTSIENNSNDFVKYDPAYIYNSGLQTFEILHNPMFQQLIFDTSKKLHEAPMRLKNSENEENADDESGGNGLFQFCSFPTVKYDFMKNCSITLTPEDKQFIKSHILTAKACKGSLLHFIVDNEDIEIAETFPGVDSKLLPDYLADIQQRAQQFADFIYLIHLRYNYIFSKHTDKTILNEFNDEFDIFRQKNIDIEKVLQTVNISENSSKIFCQFAAQDLAREDYDSLEQKIIAREKRIKGTRRKIDNPAFSYDPKNPIHHYKLDYRWGTVKTFIKELRGKETNNE